MAKRSNADFFEVLVAQISQYDKANVILGKSLRIIARALASEASLQSPASLPHGSPAALDHASSSCSAFASFRSRLSNPSVNHP
jgi:hypothetical protein